jgi:hypothetical protein
MTEETLKHIANILGLPEQLNFAGKRIQIASEAYIDEQVMIDIPNNGESLNLLIMYLWLQQTEQLKLQRPK